MEPNTPAADAPTPDNNEGGFIDSLDAYFNTPDGPDPTPVADPNPEPDSPTAPETATKPKTKTTVAPTEPADDLDSIEEPKDWTPQAARRFKELKAELKTYRTKAEELESTVTQRDARLQELEAVADNPEFKTLQDRVAEYEQQMLVTKLEQSQAYRSLVDEPLGVLVGEADSLATKYNIESGSLLDAIAESDEATQEEALSELLASATDRDKFRVYKIIEEIKPILEQRRVLQENAQEALLEAEELDRARNQQQLADRATQRLQAATSVADKLQSKLTFLSSMDGVDLKAMAKDAAASDPASLDAITGTYQAMAAKLLPKMANEYLSLQREIESLTERLAEYDKATPRAGGGTGNYGAQSAADGNKSFLDAVSAAFGR